MRTVTCSITPCRLLLATLISVNVTAAPTELRSEITEVTVFSDRAQVTRAASIKLAAGEHTLVFSRLPHAIDERSIQVGGTGPAVLADIRFERTQLTEAADERVKALERRRAELDDTIRAIDDRVAHARDERQFVQRIADGLTQPSGKEVPVELDPDKWIKMVAFYRDRLDGIDREMRLAERQRGDVDAERSKVLREQADLAGANARSVNQVQAKVLVKQAGEVTLTLSYIIAGARWSPLYDIRVASDQKTMEITYKAQVLQSTSEDWDNVKIRLSTAQPQAGVSHPELYPWHVSFYQPRYDRDEEERSGGGRLEYKSEQMMNVMKREAPPARLAKEEPPAPLMEVAGASVKAGASSAVFLPEGTTTIKSDRQPHTVTITTAKFPAAFRYSTVPKLAPQAYLKAKVRNSTEYPLLPGPTSVFFDNSFVANGSMDLVAPSEEFWTFLGIDQGIAVEHKLVRRLDKDEGALAKKDYVVFEYQLSLKNKKKTEEEIVMWDQIPLTTSEDIVVELLEPKLKDNTETVKKNESGILEWYFSLKPGQEVKVPFSFQVKYPRGRTIEGL